MAGIQQHNLKKIIKLILRTYVIAYYDNIGCVLAYKRRVFIFSNAYYVSYLGPF